MSFQEDVMVLNDPADIAVSLVEENGLDRARQIAVVGTTAANDQGNFYALSIWREVKSILRDWKETPESNP